MNERDEALEAINESVTVLVRAFLIERIREHGGEMPLAKTWSEHNVPNKDGLRFVGFEMLSDTGYVELCFRYDKPEIKKHLPRSRDEFRGLRITICASLSDGLRGALDLSESSIEGESGYAEVSPFETDEDVRVVSALLQQEAMTIRMDL